jgi:hypothetical protein
MLELDAFVAHARDRGMGHETIRHMLLALGWKEKEIACVFADRELALPIPAAHRKGGAREAFLHLTAITCMYVAAVSLVLMLFNLVNLSIPDPVDGYWEADWYRTSIRSSMSSLIVFFPLAVLFSWLIRRETSRGAITAGGAVERWLTYLTLFVIVMTVLIDGSTLIYLLLEGEMTTRVLVKGFILLAVVGVAFTYLWIGTYRWSAKPKLDDTVS